MIYSAIIISVSLIAHLGGGVTRPGHEGPVVRAEAEAHHVPSVSSINSHLLTSLHIPGGTCHVSRAGHYLGVIQEPAAGQVSGEDWCEDHYNMRS